MRPKASSRHGFTLIEISITIVIIAFMIGAIFSAQVMLRNQRIKQIPSDATQYHVAATQFRQKYRYFPGDMPTASTVWTSLTFATNGDGNGVISNTEAYYAWEQLVVASFIVGPYGHSSSQVPGIDIPAGPIEKTGFGFGAANSSSSTVGTTGASSTSSYVYDGDYTAAIYFGKTYLNATLLRDPALSGEDAGYIDQAFDDGNPSVGNIVTWKATAAVTNTAACTSSSTAYDRSQKDLICALIFVNPYLKRFQ